MLLLAGGVFVAQPVRDGSWPGYLPTLALVVAERQGADVVDKEVRRRVNEGRVDGWSAKILAESLVQELRDDDVRWNAERAVDMLDTLWPASREALETELGAGDTQSRILAARILRNRCETPSDDLLWACVQDLRDDRGDVRWYLSLRNAGDASNYLIRFAPRAKPLLREAMQSEDRQQRLLAAAIAGYSGLTELVDPAAAILIEHLRDNKITGDASIAAPAIFRFGLDVLPHLEPHTTSEDVQLRESALAIIERLTYPDRSLGQLEHPTLRFSVNLADSLVSDGIYPSLHWRWE